MTKGKYLAGLLVACFLGFLPLACMESSVTPTGTYGGYGGTPTPTTSPGTPTPVYSISVVSGPHYSTDGSTALTMPITIQHGQSIAWNSVAASNTHPLNLDGGAASSCILSGQTNATTQTFANAGTFYFHCSIHSSCGACMTTSNYGTGCTGNMAATIVVQ